MNDLSPGSPFYKENGIRSSDSFQADLTLPKLDRLEKFNKITGNISFTKELIDRYSQPSELLKSAIKQLSLIDTESSLHIIDKLEREGKLNHIELEKVLQEAFFKPNESKFSFQIAVDGEKPTTNQLEVFSKLKLSEVITVPQGERYDCGVIFGGTLAAINARTRNLLRQFASLKSIALLGGERKVIQGKETGEELEKVIGERHYQELAEKDFLPKTEFELMTCLWESYCRRDESLRSIPIIEIDSQLRIGKIKEAPGTPDTVVDLHNTIVSGYRIPGLDSHPTSFLLSSSQPHAIRQSLDFVASMLILDYPATLHVDAVGYTTESQPALKLYGTELAKLIHSLYLLRY